MAGENLAERDERTLKMKKRGLFALFFCAILLVCPLGARALSAQGVSKTSFSKYGTAYQIITQQSKGVATYA